MKPYFVSLLAALSLGCLLDSVQPWLSRETVVETTTPLDGEWSVVDAVELFGDGGESIVTLTHKPATSRRKEFFYIKVRPKTRDTQFVFQATVHEIENLRFLQIWNFTHWDGGIFSLANRPTYSLWRVEADKDNIIIWLPDLNRSATDLNTIRDQDNKVLFIDSTAKNEKAIRDWARAYRIANERPRKVMPLALTRVGTEFAMPASAMPHMPIEYERSKASEPRR